MRASSFWIIALSTTMLTACSPGFDAGEKNNKEAIVSQNADLQRKLAMASEAGGDLAAAERMYSKLAEDGSKQATIELASFYTRNNRPDSAVNILDKAYMANPGDTDLMRAYANSLISAGRAQSALELLDKSIASGTTNGYVYNSRGVALDTLGQYKQAQQSYQKAMSLSPSDEADFKTNLSMSYILSGEYHTAIETLEPMMKTKGSTPQSRQNLALAYGLIGDMETAMRIGSKDISLKEMKENIRFYQHFSETKGMSSVKKNVPALSMDETPAKPVAVTAAEGELPPPPPPPMKNLTQYPAAVQPVAIAPAAVDPVVAPVAQSPSPPPEKPAAVAESAPLKVANPNYVDQYTPSPKPIEPIKIAPAEPMAAAVPMASTTPKQEPVQHKMLKPAPKETGVVPASEMPKALDDDFKNEDVLNLQPSAGGNKKPVASVPSPSDILNAKEAAKLMESIPANEEVQSLQPAAGETAKAKVIRPSEEALSAAEAKMSSSDLLNSREAAKFMDEDKPIVPAPVLKPDNW